MLRIPLLAMVCALSLLGLDGHAQTARDASRGELLYANHCIACHSAQVHWRQNKAATSWATLLVEVRRWQAAGQLGWSDADIAEVARYLNTLHYRFAPTG